MADAMPWGTCETGGRENVEFNEGAMPLLLEEGCFIFAINEPKVRCTGLHLHLKSYLITTHYSSFRMIFITKLR